MLYIDVDESGEILACGTTPVNDSEICLEVVDPMELMETIQEYRYVEEELVRKSQEEIDAIYNAPQPLSELEILRNTVERQEIVIDELMFNIIPMILGGGE